MRHFMAFIATYRSYSRYAFIAATPSLASVFCIKVEINCCETHFSPERRP